MSLGLALFFSEVRMFFTVIRRVALLAKAVPKSPRVAPGVPTPSS
ncbi:hypothetical protein [Corallococcus sp. EGB]|nr:hypothetical protein [Corallococcus sp. EGB]